MSHWEELSFLRSGMSLVSNLKAQLSSEFLNLRGVGVGLSCNCSKADRKWRVMSLAYFKQTNMKKQITEVLGWGNRDRLAHNRGQAAMLGSCPQKHCSSKTRISQS